MSSILGGHRICRVGSIASTVLLVMVGACTSAAGDPSVPDSESDAGLDAAELADESDTLPGSEPSLDAGVATTLASPHPRGWSEVAATGIARESSTVTLLADGRLLVVSGHRLQPFTTELDPALPEDSAEVYDPVADQWEPTPLMASGHFGGPAALLGDGRVLVAGGWPQNEAYDVEVFDPATWTWTAGAAMARRRQGFDLAEMPDGGLLAAGGIDWVRDGEIVSDVERYDPATGEWARLADLPEPRIASVVPWSDGRLILLGGEWATSTWLYRPEDDSWGVGPTVQGRRNEAMVLLKDGRILRSGGLAFESFDDGKIATADLLDPVTGANTPTGPMHHVRSLFTLTELTGGRVLAAGGSGPDGGGLATAEIWDPATGEWTLTEPMLRARWNHAAVPIFGGTEVLIIGGYSHQPLPQAMRQCEVFRPE